MKKKRFKYSYLLIVLLFGTAILSVGFAGEDVKGKKKNVSKINNINKITQGGKYGDSYRLNINNINLPMNSSGVLADVNIAPDGTKGKFDESGFLFSGGFFLSGFSGDRMFANAVASASLVGDYLPGPVGKTNDPNAVIYVLKRTDPVFGEAWNDWKDAVALGADFYDGDGDGVYNPVDLNGNGAWDPTEDSPDILGDETVWCVYNDAVAAPQRRWNTVNPLGIEVRQTVFALASKGAIGNIIFIRYRLKYIGLGNEGEPDRLNDVYFGVWDDPDIGDASNDVNIDLVGSDVSRNAIYTYKSGPSESYGVNPPAFFATFFSGPVEFIPGETFTDVNGNGLFEEGTDIPLDTAFSVRGQIIGKVAIPGARNQPLSSVVEYLNGFSSAFDDPDNHTVARNFMLGLLRDGGEVDPCTLPIGQVMGGVDCNTVDPRFWFSGDPVTGVGWIGTQPWDVRQMSNTGPFTLYKDTPENREAGRLIEKEIVAAYVVGRGTDHLNSIEVAREINDISQNIFDNNFPSPPPPPPISYETRTGEDFIDITWQTAPHVNYRAVDTVLDFDRRVQGFYVNAFRTNTPTAVVGGVENIVEVANFSINNGIENIYFLAPNGGVDLRREVAPENQLDSITYADISQGRIRLTITQDPFTGGDLVKGKEYYFAITQYTLNHNSIVNRETGEYGPPGDYLELGSAYEEFDFLSPTQLRHATDTKIITVVFGDDLYSPALDPNAGVKFGAADGNVKYLVVNPEELTGNDYKVEFFKDQSALPTEPYSPPFWRLINQTTGEVLIDSSKIYNFDTTSYAGRVTEGFLLKVQPITPQIDITAVDYSEEDWFTTFRSDSLTGVYYVGQDLAEASPVTVGSNVGINSSYITADRLKRVELRFGTTGKAYRYLNGFIGTALTRRQSGVYAEGVTAADTGSGKGSVGMLGVGYVDVPFTAWVVDENFDTSYQLAVGFIELSSTLGGNPDGVYDPGTLSTPFGNEFIFIFDAPYDPNGGQVQYTGNSNVWADILRGFSLSAPGATQEQINIAASRLFNPLYTVGFKRHEGSQITPGTLAIPVQTYPYTDMDEFTFKTRTGGALTENEEKNLFDKINVFPNPLYGFNPATSYSNSPADEPFVTFSNLPQEDVTVRIYTLSGTLIRTLTSDDPNIRSTPAAPFMQWDLQNESGLRVASGLYLAIVSVPNFGEKILKFSIIMPQKQLQRF